MTNRDIVYSPEEVLPYLEQAAERLAKLFTSITNVSSENAEIEFQYWSKETPDSIFLTFAGGQVSNYEVEIKANDTPFEDEIARIASYFYAFYWGDETDGEDTAGYQ